jgi:glycosyltransferase involved in cell wall biosynthesis
LKLRAPSILIPIKISIIIPLHNKGNYLAETLESIISQRFCDWEAIVVENNSCDDGPFIAQRFATEDQRIRFFDASSSIYGPGAARNFGLNHSSSEWVLFLDADDQIEKGHLESLMAQANRNPTANIIAGKWKEYREDNPTKLTLQHPACCDEGRDDLLGYSIAFAPWAVHAAIVRRAAITDDLRWPEELDRVLGEDILFWFRLLHQNEVAFCESAAALYRTHTPNRRNQLQEITKWHCGASC